MQLPVRVLLAVGVHDCVAVRVGKNPNMLDMLLWLLGRQLHRLEGLVFVVLLVGGYLYHYSESWRYNGREATYRARELHDPNRRRELRERENVICKMSCPCCCG